MAKLCTILGKAFEMCLYNYVHFVILFPFDCFQMLPYSDKMTFTQRWYNTMLTAYGFFVRHYKFLPSEEELARKHFAHLAPLPPLYNIIRNVSLILVNSHRAISPPRPSMPSKFLRYSLNPKPNPFCVASFHPRIFRCNSNRWRSYKTSQTVAG